MKDEDDEMCPKNDGGEHVPDMRTLTFCQEDSTIIDVSCVNCGRSGSIHIRFDDINW